MNIKGTQRPRARKTFSSSSRETASKIEGVFIDRPAAKAQGKRNSLRGLSPERTLAIVDVLISHLQRENNSSVTFLPATCVGCDEEGTPQTNPVHVLCHGITKADLRIVATHSSPYSQLLLQPTGLESSVTQLPLVIREQTQTGRFGEWAAEYIVDWAASSD